MKKLLAGIAAMMAATGAASAADLGGRINDDPGYASVPGATVNWTGIYLGGTIGYGNANHNLKDAVTVDDGLCELPPESEDGPPYNQTDCVAANGVWTADIQTLSSSFIDGINSHGVFGGGTIGADVQRRNFLFGVFGDYNFSALKTEIGGSDGENSFSETIIEEGDSWVAAVRAGYLFGQEKRALLYVLGGYGQTDVSYRLGEDAGDRKDVTFSGFVAGAGGEYALTDNVFLGIEYQHFFGGEETLFSEGSLADGETKFKVTDEVDTDKVMAKLKFKLSGGVDRLY